MTATCFRRTLAGIFIVALLALGTAIAAGKRPIGQSAFSTDPRTDAGDWYGTWVYKSRHQRVVIWIREDSSGQPEYRLQYQSMGSAEAFNTDWTGRADYAVTGTDASFQLKAVKRDENSITGTLEWDLQFEMAGRRKSGEFEMYRAGDGRLLVMHFFNHTVTIRREGKEASDQSDTAWNFSKASKRQVLWEEIF